MKITHKINGIFFLLPWLCLAQQAAKVDFKTLNADLLVNHEQKLVTGTLHYEFDVIARTDTIYIDGVNMIFSDVKLNGKNIIPKSSPKGLKLYGRLKKGKNQVTFVYQARPKQAMYFTGTGSGQQIWTQGQGKYTSHWLPSFDDVNEKVVFNISVAADTGDTVISNGVLTKTQVEGGRRRWFYRMQQPMSSYLVMLAIGKFAKKTETSSSGIPLELYYGIGDEDKVGPTYRHSKKIFDFLEQEIGVDYPWEIYRQVPVRDFLYAGMENTSATVFAQDFVVDETGFNDKDYINVNAHELAHQWFGDMVTAKSGRHHWLQEGFATYYALLAERHVFGDDYFYNQLYNYAEELQKASKTDTVPVMNEKASSLTFYKKGAWALHVLRESIGADNFRKAVKSYLEKYAFGNVDTDAFLAEVSKVSDYDLPGFRKRWLENPKFEVAEAVTLLQKNEFMRQLFATAEISGQPSQWDQIVEMYVKRMRSEAYYPLKQEWLYRFQSDFGQKPFAEKVPVYRAALATGDIKVRQAVVQTIGTFPESFYAEFATLLDDRSYITQEMAMAVLWKQFPSRHKELLVHTKGRVGFNDKNLRIQWLTMALMEKDYEADEKVKYYDELIDYASPNHESSIRQNALENLIFLGPGDTNMLKALVNPLVHHKWQFSKFARDKIRELIAYPQPRQFYEKLLPDLPEAEKTQLRRLLDAK